MLTNKKIQWNPNLWMRFPLARPPAHRLVRKSLLQLTSIEGKFLNYGTLLEEEETKREVIDIDMEEYLSNNEILDGEKLMNVTRAMEAQEFMDSADEFLLELEKAAAEREGKTEINDNEENSETYEDQVVLDGEKLTEKMGVFAPEGFIGASEDFLKEIEKDHGAEISEELLKINEAKAEPALSQAETLQEDTDVIEDFSTRAEEVQETPARKAKTEPALSQTETLQEDTDVIEDFSTRAEEVQETPESKAKAEPAVSKAETLSEDTDVIEDFSTRAEEVQETVASKAKTEPALSQTETPLEDTDIIEDFSTRAEEVQETVASKAKAEPALSQTETPLEDTDVIEDFSTRAEEVQETVASKAKAEPAVSEIKSRKRIFTEELEQVTSEVLEHSPEAKSLLQSIPVVDAFASETRQETEQKLLETDTFEKGHLAFLRRLYKTEILKEESFLPLQNDILTHFKADALAFLLWDRFQLTYRPILHSGLKQEKEFLYNLNFISRDPFLKEELLSQSWDRDSMLKNPLSLRRFGEASLRAFSAVHILKIENQKGTKAAFLMLLYEKFTSVQDPILESKLKAPAREYMAFLKEAILPLRRFRESIWYEKIGVRQLGLLTKEALSAMQQLAGKSRKAFYALHFRLAGIENEKNWRRKIYPLSKFLSKHLNAQEKILIHNMNRILFLLQQTDPNHIIKLAQEFCDGEDMQLYLSLNEYPKEGYNLYQYLEGPI